MLNSESIIIMHMLCVCLFLMIPRPTIATRMTRPFPTLRSPDQLTRARPRLQLRYPDAGAHGVEQIGRHVHRRLGEAPGRPLGLAADHPGVAAVPAVLVDGAVAVEHDMGAGLDLAGLQSGLQHDGGVGAARMAPDHAAGIVDEAAEFGHRDGIRSEEHTSELQSLMRTS